MENIRLKGINTLILLITYWKRIKYVLINDNNNENKDVKIKLSWIELIFAVQKLISIMYLIF